MIRHALLPALLGLATACGGGGMDFDEAKWASGRGFYDADSPRISMVGEAERAGVRPGATRAQVRALLGEPDGTDPHPDNARAIRAYEKAGFAAVSGPLDTRWGRAILMESWP